MDIVIVPLSIVSNPFQAEVTSWNLNSFLFLLPFSSSSSAARHERLDHLKAQKEPKIKEINKNYQGVARRLNEQATPKGKNQEKGRIMIPGDWLRES